MPVLSGRKMTGNEGRGMGNEIQQSSPGWTRDGIHGWRLNSDLFGIIYTVFGRGVRQHRYM